MKNSIEFFYKEYQEDNWNRFIKNFPPINLEFRKNLDFPLDIFKCLIFLLGENYALIWINTKLKSLEYLTPIELVKTDKSLKALKAFIMRMPS